MKRIILSLLLSFCAFGGWAQSRFVSNTQMPVEDRATEDPSHKGVLVLSKNPDLLITVINDNDHTVVQRGKQQSGYYEYEVYINDPEMKAPKIDVSHRGDINHTTFMPRLKKGRLCAYLIDEVEKPITMENQTTKSDAILDEQGTLAEVEFTSTISNLKIVVSPKLQATVKQRQKPGDASVTLTSVVIPAANITEPQKQLAQMQAECERLNKPLTPKSSDKEFERFDTLRSRINRLSDDLMTRFIIEVYAEGTNRLSVDVSGLTARAKQCFGVLMLKTVVREHASKCAGFLEEGNRQYALRNYDEARRAFNNALTASDAPASMEPTIRTSIAQCDSCSLYELYTRQTLARIKKLKEEGGLNQANVAEIYDNAVQFLQVLNRYNPCDFYSKSIHSLQNFIKDMPFKLRFNVVHLKVTRVSVVENGPFGGVEVWAYNGTDTPSPATYRSRKEFTKATRSAPDLYTRMSMTGPDGVAELDMKRSSLPKGFFLVPMVDNKTDIYYKDAEDVMSKAQGTFTQRQFRVKMYQRD